MENCSGTTNSTSLFVDLSLYKFNLDDSSFLLDLASDSFFPFHELLPFPLLL
jgi:hypothetical protein